MPVERRPFGLDVVVSSMTMQSAFFILQILGDFMPVRKTTTTTTSNNTKEKSISQPPTTTTLSKFCVSIILYHRHTIIYCYFIDSGTCVESKIDLLSPNTTTSSSTKAIKSRIDKIMSLSSLSRIITEQEQDKGIPRLREWELTEDSTRYEINIAAPSDETLVVHWSIWTGVALFAGIFVLVVFIALIINPRIRRQPFNCYLLYLMIPDFVFSLSCGVTCLLNTVKGSYWSHTMCNWQQFYVVWGVGSNCWINAIISYQIHNLLKCSQASKTIHHAIPKASNDPLFRSVSLLCLPG